MKKLVDDKNLGERSELTKQLNSSQDRLYDSEKKNQVSLSHGFGASIFPTLTFRADTLLHLPLGFVAINQVCATLGPQKHFVLPAK